MKVVILKPRLDVPFKNLGAISPTRGPISSIRQHWQNFVNKITKEEQAAGNDVQIIEQPLWMFTEEFVNSLNLDFQKLYVPHREYHNFKITKINQNSEVLYYMQTVVPWRFYVDSHGYAANVSWKEKWEDYYLNNKNTDYTAIEEYSKYLKAGNSKFEQPKSGNLITFPNADNYNYFLFTCQIPHDHTILHHSNIRVENALLDTCKAARKRYFKVLVKGHPVNPQAMEPLKEIVKEYPDNAQWIDNVSILDAIEQSSGVITVNSGTGLEALALGKPVFAFGRTEYSPEAGPIVAFSPRHYKVTPFRSVGSFMSDPAYDKFAVSKYFNFWKENTYYSNLREE